MSNALKLTKQFAADEDGTALMEYTLLLGTLIVAIIFIITALGTWVSNQWQTVCTSISGAAC
jgi:pilus assembly protein Flp/PilA